MSSSQSVLAFIIVAEMIWMQYDRVLPQRLKTVIMRCIKEGTEVFVVWSGMSNRVMNPPIFSIIVRFAINLDRQQRISDPFLFRSDSDVSISIVAALTFRSLVDFEIKCGKMAPRGRKGKEEVFLSRLPYNRGGNEDTKITLRGTHGRLTRT